jgi:hypothetical protein
MPKLRASQFKFRKNDSVGAESAELDNAYDDCYYDIGDLEALRDCAGTKCIVVGRTGAGKSALLLELERREEHSVRIDPDGLSLQYLSNSTILNQIEALGVKLGLFYKLLWKHVFAVELIKAKYHLRTEADTRTFLERFWDVFRRDRQKEKAIDYLRKWGEEFWKDTEYRVREVTSKLETDVRDSLGVKYPGILDVSSSEAEKITVEEKADVVKRIQEVVDAIQVRELTHIIKMLGEYVFASTQPRFYVLLDDLDKDWVDDQFRYRLIKALVETVSEINKNMPGVKIVLAIRRDLLDRVIHETRDAGFQEEKYEPLSLNLKWNKKQLIEMLDRRINKLIRRRYTGDPVAWSNLMPSKVNKSDTVEYMIERTMYRPRDLIVFFNICIDQALDRPDITAQMILHAEGEYSQKRLRSLYDEWHAEFPELEAAVGILKGRPCRFTVESIAQGDIQDLCLRIATNNTSDKATIYQLSLKVAEGRGTAVDFLNCLMGVFYRIGIVGLKIETSTAPSWTFRHASSVPSAAIRDDTSVFICPVFWRALGVSPMGGAS